MTNKLTPLISIAVPTYNREEVLVDTINDILFHQSLKEIELLVIDQTTDHKPETQRALDAIKDPRFRYFKVAPVSLTAARNFALKKARAPYIVFLDDDIRADKKLAQTFLQTFRDMPDVAAIAGRVMQEGFKTLPILRFDEYAISHGGYTSLESGFTNAFPGGNHGVVVKKALQAGGYDTRYHGTAFREENDLSLRLSRLGEKIFYQPQAKILHLAAPYGGTRVKTHIYDNPGFYVNELFFTLRFVRLGNLPRALWRKHREYCRSVGGSHALKRNLMFAAGLVRACYRFLFGRQRVAKEVA